MKRKSLILAALALSLLPAVAEAGSRGYGHYSHRRPHSGFDFSIGFGGHSRHSYYHFGASHGRPFYGHGYGASFYGRPSYYRSRSYYRPVVERYYSEPCYDYRPSYRYHRTNYYYDRPSQPYYPRRYYRYHD